MNNIATTKVKLRETGALVNVAISDDGKPKINDQIKNKWQVSLNTLTTIFDVPASLIMKLLEEDIEVFLAGQADDNPYHAGDSDKLGHGLYCETVVARNEALTVHNALSDPIWKDNPDVSLDMIYYKGMPIRWPDGSTFGTICILDRKTRTYADAYENVLRDYRDMIESDLEREIYIEALKSSSAAQDLRMREVHHRVKNHFAIISQLIQIDAINKDPNEILKIISSKLRTVALLHEKIYKDMGQAPDLESYIKAVAQTTIDIAHKNTLLEMDFQVKPIVDQKHMLDFGLVTSELITNSIKYGYSDEVETKITISLSLFSSKKGEYIFEIRDNGPGMSDDALNGSGRSGIGSMMVESFVKSHRGKVEKFNDNGAVTRCIIML